MPSQPIPAASLLLVAVALLISGLFWYAKYTGLSRGNAFLALLGSIIPTAIFAVRSTVPGRHGGERFTEGSIFVETFARGLCCVLAVAFIVRLWGRWVGGKATADERQPGIDGVRAWFSSPNVIVGVLLVVCGWYGFDVPPLLSTVAIAALLAADPIIRMESPAITPTPVAEDLSAEREKIVSMLEAGKLSAEESAELLQALGGSSRAAVARPVPLTGGQRLMLIGAALVGLGFFLPWFVVNPGQEMGRVMQQMQTSMQSQLGGTVEMPSGFPFGQGQMKTANVTLSGGDIQRGLGWATLFLALAAALIPYVATTLDPATARTVRVLCLGIGGLIVLYLLTQNLRYVGVGLIIAVSGYAVEIAGAMRERRSTAPGLH